MSSKTVGVALELALDLLARAQQVSALVLNAQQQNRDTLNDSEWQLITDADNGARQALVDAIRDAQVEP